MFNKKIELKKFKKFKKIIVEWIRDIGRCEYVDARKGSIKKFY